MTAPLVSVLMAVGPGARADWAAEALRSLLRQIAPPAMEVIIVLDGAPFEITDEPDDWGPDAGGLLRLVSQAHAGLAASLNRAACLAGGHLYARMDADDIAHPKRLARQVDALRSLGVDVLGTWAHEYGVVNGLMRYPVGHTEILAAMPRHNPFCHPTVLMRREAFWRAGGYEGGPGQDWRLWRRMAAQGARFANLPEPLLYYRRHRGQVSAGWRGRAAAWSGRLSPLLRVPGQRSH